MQGWLARNSATDVRQAWELLSPDGDIRITGGDAAIPYHTEPNQMLAIRLSRRVLVLPRLRHDFRELTQLP